MSLRGPGPGGSHLAGPFSCPCTLKCSTLYSSLPATASYQKGVVGTATEELLSLQEAADRLGVSVYTVRRWIKDGKLRAIKPGKEYRVRQSDLEEFLRSREVHPKAPYRSPFEPTFNDALGEERHLGYLRAWRAFVYKLLQEWKQNPPKTEAEIGVVMYAMQALLNEGAFQRPPETLTTRDSREASEWLDLSYLFRGIDRLNQIADAVQEDAEAERRRAAFHEIKGQMAG
jgi:excisionase family DNA binding protein